MKTDDFDYCLPDCKIAQTPEPIRDACKLLVLDKNTGYIEDRIFRNIVDYLRPKDLLIANETRVMPARMLGTKKDSGGKAEVFLLREDMSRGKAANSTAIWEALVKPGKRLKPGAVVEFFSDENTVLLEAEILDFANNHTRGARRIALSTPLESIDEALHRIGNTPLPPYIKNYQGDKELYQTVFAQRERSAAAPTAGLHFTPQLIEQVKNLGVGFETVELEVGLDTFRIVDEENPRNHQIHTETYHVPQNTIDAIEEAKCQGGRVIAVGTTSVRCLESAWNDEKGRLLPKEEDTTSLFILPGYQFKVVDALITNFHVPRSTLLMLVSALSSRKHIMNAYEHALENNYRFLSFGDAMLIH